MAALLAAWLTAFAAAALAMAQGGGEPHAPPLHVTQAEWQSLDSPGFKPPSPLLEAEALTGAWQVIALPHALPVALVRQATAGSPAGVTRTTWYRISVPDSPLAAGPLALYASRVRTDGTVAVYADGQLVHRAQPQGPLWDSSRTPLWLVPENTAAGRAPHEIVIRLEHSRASQVALSSLWLGQAEDIGWRFRSRQWLQQDLPAMASAAFLAVGLFSLFVWLRRRHKIGYLLFFILATASFMRGLHFYSAVPIANDAFAWMTVNSLLWLVTVVHFSLGLLHRRRQRWLDYLLIGMTTLIGVLTLPAIAALPNTPRVTPLIYVVAALMGAVVGIAGAIQGWRRSSEALLVAAGIGVCTLFGATDWLLQNNFISPEGWYLGAYTNVVSFAVFAYIMNRRYVGAIADVEQVNAGLALRLKSREDELAGSYARLREVEQRQTLSQERQRLTQDMHDGLGSSLVSALRVVESGRLGDADVAEVLKGCIDDLKLAIDSMEPVDADLLLLLATLRFRLGPRLAGAGIALRWDITEVPTLDWLDPRNALHILRILQEAFSNILKHTRATVIRVSTQVEGDAWIDVTIGDNGGGFALDEALARGGKGLGNQMRRAQAIGGEISWGFNDDGAQLTLRLPQKRLALDNAAHDDAARSLSNQ